MIEVLIRLERILDESDKQLIGEQLNVYLETGSGKYVYGLKSDDLPRELEKLGKVYYAVHGEINGKEKYQDKKEFVNFERASQGGKTKVRGQFKTSLFAFNTGIAINFGRIFRYIVEYELFNCFSFPIALIHMKNLLKNNPMVIFTRKLSPCQSNFQLIRDYSKYFSNLQTVAA